MQIREVRDHMVRCAHCMTAVAAIEESKRQRPAAGAPMPLLMKPAEPALFRISAMALISLAATTLAISLTVVARRLGDFRSWNRGVASASVLNIQRASDEAPADSVPASSHSAAKNGPMADHFRRGRVAKTVAREMSDDSAEDNDDAASPLRAGFGEPARVESVSSRSRAIASRARGEELNLLKPIIIESAHGETMWRIARGGAIARSSDGMNWHPLNSGTNVDLLAAEAPSTEVCWVVGRFGTVLRTTDGERWQRMSSPTADDLRAVEAFDESTAIVATEDDRTFATSDGGKSWHPTK